VKILAALIVAAVVAAPALKRDVGEPTYGLAAGGGSVWVGGLGSGDVLRVDPGSGKVIARVSIGARAFNLAAAPGAVWGIANLTNTAARIDTRTGKVTASVSVGSGPYDVEWGFGSAWVSNSLDGTVSRITGQRVVKTIKVGVEPNGLAAIGRYLWVTDHTAGLLLRLDPRTNRISGRVPLAGADWVTGFHGSLYVSQETNVVTRVDARTLKVLGRVKVHRNPLGSAIVSDRLWVPCIDSNDIVVVDPATMKLVKTIAAGPGPIVVLPDGGHVWVSHTTGTAIWRL
jgi:DNA-binding beta-propeller fold protein YncE